MRPILALFAVSAVWVPHLARADGAASSPSSFEADIAAWRANRQEGLRSESGWLSLVGLYWLHEGENRFGADPQGDIVLPAGSAPPSAGSFFLEHGKVRVTAEAGAVLTLAGAPVVTRDDLQGDDRQTPDKLGLGDLSLQVIRRGQRVGIRVKSPNTQARRQFRGLDYFPASESYRVTARFIRARAARKIPLATVIGTVEPMTAPGTLEFTLGGRTLHLDPVLETDDAKELFIIFRDETADHETYPAGRFLYAELPRDGKVVLDFNKAENPPCAFTDFATCPLPPRQNILPVRIEAGEKRYAGSEHRQ